MATAEQTVHMALELGRQGRPRDGIAQLRRFLQRQPANLLASAALGQLLMQAGEAEQAIFQFERCVKAEPSSAAHQNNYGLALGNAGRCEQAVAAFRQAVTLDPKYAKGWVGLAMQLLRVPDCEGAVAAARTAIGLNPDLAEAYQNLGLGLLESGHVEEAVAAMRDGLARAPWHGPMRSAMLIALNNLSTLSPIELCREHEAFGRAFAPRATIAPARTSREPDRRLRIGVLSSDFRTHSVMYFFEPVLEHHDRAKLEFVCLSTGSRADETTARLKRHAAAWIDADVPDDAALDRLIRGQRLDILIELGGHSAGNRLAALKDKPAPLIVSAIGYPNTTGLGAVGYRVVDSLTDPPGSEAHATERLVRLNPCFLCYRPPPAPEPASRPADGPPVFGSFNALTKLSPETLRTWGQLMGRVPGSRLVLKAVGLRDAWARRTLLSRLEFAGVERERVELLAPTVGLAEHLASYARIDLALDPFPYNGTTTTCEAMWMGVPVVAMAGDRHAARVGLSLISAVGLPELVAPTMGQYVEIAARLAADRGRLAEMRTGLRARMAASVLCDGPGYARRIEGALRGIWREWCAGQGREGAARA